MFSEQGAVVGGLVAQGRQDANKPRRIRTGLIRRAAESVVPVGGTTGVHAALESGPEPGGRGNLIDIYHELPWSGLGVINKDGL